MTPQRTSGLCNKQLEASPIRSQPYQCMHSVDLIRWPAGVDMQRPEFLGVLGGAAVAWPRAIHAQEAGCIYRLGTTTPSLKIAASPILAFFDELLVIGFVEGQNLKVDGGGYGLRDEQIPMHPPGADRRRHL